MGPLNAVLVLMLLPNRVLALGRSVVLPSAVLVRGPLPRLPKLPLAFLGSILPIVDLAFLRSPALPIAPLASPMFATVPLALLRLALLRFLGSMPLPSTVPLVSVALPIRFLPDWLAPGRFPVWVLPVRFPGRPLPGRFGRFLGVTAVLAVSFLPDRMPGSFFLGSSLLTPFFFRSSRSLRGSSNCAVACWPPASPSTAIARMITIDPAKNRRLVGPGPRRDMAQTLVLPVLRSRLRRLCVLFLFAASRPRFLLVQRVR